MIDVKHQISEVRRTVGGRVLEAGEARVVTISQADEGSLDDGWDACTNPERIARWFLPVSGDLRLGGRRAGRRRIHRRRAAARILTAWGRAGLLRVLPLVFPVWKL